MSSLKGSSSAVPHSPVSCVTSNSAGRPNLSHSHASGYNPSSCFTSASPVPLAGHEGQKQSSSAQLGAFGDSRQEVQDLKEQLEALRCQVGCLLQLQKRKMFPFLFWFKAEMMSSHCCQGKMGFRAQIWIGGRAAPPSGDSGNVLTA